MKNLKIRPQGKRPARLRTLLALSALLGVLVSSAQAAQQVQGVVYHDRNNNGTRDPGETGVSKVCVSNGREVVQSDRRGRYALSIEDDSILFVIKPSGWMTPTDANQLPRFSYVHKPQGSPSLHFKGVAPTGPLPPSVDFPLSRNREPEAFDVVLFGDTQPGSAAEVNYIAHDVVEELVGTDAAFGLTLGDVAGNDLDLLDGVNRAVGCIGIPWYNVMGNHDSNRDTAEDRYTDETFERIYGPTYYAFAYGRVHFLVLDSVVWEGQKYHGALGRRQLDFIRNYLAFVPENDPIVLAMHIPLSSLRARRALYALLKERPHVIAVAGHWHQTEHYFLGQEEGWPNKTPLHLYVAGAVCGSWWSGTPDENGIPHATMMDGSPNGYSILSFDGTDYTLRFKAARRPADYQMSIFAPDVVAASEAEKTEVVVNVFAGSSRSIVEMRLGAGGPWVPMTQVTRVDPQVAAFKGRDDTGPGKQLPWMSASQCLHLWAAPLPERPPQGTTLLAVRATDMFGQTHTAHRVITVQ